MRVGIIGASPDRGWAARAHVPALKALPGFELVAVSTSREESARRAVEVFSERPNDSDGERGNRDGGEPHAPDTGRRRNPDGAGPSTVDGGPAALRGFADAAELVRLPEVDLVVVTVKVSAHADLVRQAIATGKDVYCEWPLALSIEEAVELEELARKAGVRAFIGLQARYSPGFAYARHLIRNGSIGRLTSATLYSSRAKGSTQSVPGWTAYTYDKNAGAGLVEVLGGHALDLLEHIAGPITTATARTSIQHPRHTIAETGESIDVTAPDHLDVIGELQAGAAFSVHLHDGEAGIPRTRLELAGTEASLTVESIPDANPWSAQLQIAELAVRRSGEPLRIPDHFHTAPPELSPEPASVARLYQQVAASPDTAPGFATGVHLHEILTGLAKAAVSLRDGHPTPDGTGLDHKP